MFKYEIQTPGQRGWKTEQTIEGPNEESAHTRCLSFYALYDAPKRILKSEVVHIEEAKDAKANKK